MEAWRAYSIGDTGALRPVAMTTKLNTTKLNNGVYNIFAAPDQVGITYQPGDRVTAQCINGQSIQQVHSTLEDWESHLCGLYARRTLAGTISYLLQYVQPGTSFGFAVGPVLLEGQVIVGSKGFRAEHMTILPPEHVLLQEDVKQPSALHSSVCKKPLWSSDLNGVVWGGEQGKWKGLRVISWVQWKEQERWILERQRRSSRWSQRSFLLRSQFPSVPSPKGGIDF